MWWGKMFASLILAQTLETQTGHGARPRPVAMATLGQHILPLCKLWHRSRLCNAGSFHLWPGSCLSSCVEEKGVCTRTNWGTKREEINAEWEGESPKDWDRCAIQSSEASLCSLNYLWYFRLGMLHVGAIQLLALLSKTQKQKLKSGGRKGL